MNFNITLPLLKGSIVVVFVLIGSLACISQSINLSDVQKDQYGLNNKVDNMPYSDALKLADKYYSIGDYANAAPAFDEVFRVAPDKEHQQQDRLFAAASHCMNDNEEGVRKHLLALAPISTKRDRQKVLINYEIFNKYKGTAWWKDLASAFDERLHNLIQHHQNLKIFQKGRNFVYKAIRITEAGDTLADTTVTMEPDGTGWGDDANPSQSQVIYTYHFDTQDSLDHIDELVEIVTAQFWLRQDTTGIIESSKKFWIHPIRNNEFFKTEVAPFPTVLYPISDETMQAHKPKVIIFKNWGSYSGSMTESDYSYLGKEQRNYAGLKDLACHKYQAESFNNFHGLSHVEYYFNEDYGFVEMNYVTYDQDRIQFVLDQIEIK